MVFYGILWSLVRVATVAGLRLVHFHFHFSTVSCTHEGLTSIHERPLAG